MIDTNAIIRAYLAADAGLIPLVNDRIFCPRLPENTALPAISFFTRGGVVNPHIPDLVTPSVQFDCWAETSLTESGNIVARRVYRALYDALQGIENVAVGANVIVSAIEEVQGQDLVDIEVSGYFRTLTFFQIMVR